MVQSIGLGTGLALEQLSVLTEMPLSFTIPADFQLKILATKWGFSGSMDEFCTKAKAAGYDGFEVRAPATDQDRLAIENAARNHQLEYGFILGFNDGDFKTHYSQFTQALSAAASLKPLYINCHAGKDHFTQEQAQQIFDFSLSEGKKKAVPVYHETHRGRICYSAPITRAFLEKIPDLRLTLDISHWCVVHESLLEDQKETVALALSRTDHIHARVGHPEGPQVNDPRAPEWATALQAHLNWWDQVVEMKVKQQQSLTILTEFGPPTYLPTLPYTLQPVADQWSINVFMLQLLRSRYRNKN